MKNSQLYDQDFYAWANEQAGLLRAGKLAEADIAYIACGNCVPEQNREA